MPERPPTPLELAGIDDPTTYFRRIGSRFEVNTVGKLREEIEKIDHLPLTEEIILFGSRARGDWSRSSDFDIYIRLSEIPEDKANKKLHLTETQEKYADHYDEKISKILSPEKTYNVSVQVLVHKLPLRSFALEEEWDVDYIPLSPITLWETDCEKQLSEEEIRDIAYKVIEECEGKYDENLDIGKRWDCYTLSREMAEKLKERGYDANRVEGLIGKEPHLTDRHAWVSLPSDQVEGYEEGPIYVDPTIGQFSSERAREGLVNVDLGVGLPEVGIYSPKDRKWEWYR